MRLILKTQALVVGVIMRGRKVTCFGRREAAKWHGREAKKIKWAKLIKITKFRK